MAAITIQNVMKQFGDRVVLDGVSIELQPGEIVGLVGPNGAGKTTLFRLIAGHMQPDFGTVTRARGLAVGYLPQIPEVDLERTLHDEVLSAFEDVLALEQKMLALSEQIAEHHDTQRGHELMAQYDKITAQFQTSGGYEYEQRVGEILGGLGFEPADYKLKMNVLSGGQKCRAALAKLLLRDTSYLLLDEPTNHLDIDAVRWLEKFLAGHHGGAAIISHDRYLLDRVASRIIEVDQARLKSYTGNYSTYAETRRVERLTQERQFDKDAAFLEKERDFIARHLAGQRSNEAKGRRTRLERRMAAGEFVTQRPGERATLKISFDTEVDPGRVVLRSDGLAKGFERRPLFSDLNLMLQATQRLGITGPNGTGKSTLLKVLLGEMPASAGSIERDPRAAVGYFSQDASELDSGSTVIGEIRAVRSGWSEQQVRTTLGAFLFSGEDVFKPIRVLSGGERARVRLLKLILAQPNVLVLDEPTNHLDIPSREALEEALDDFPGAILAVSHDRYFLDRIVDRLLVIRPEGHRHFLGNYTAYVESLEREQSAAATAREAAQEADKAKRSASQGSGAAKARPSGGKKQRSPLDRMTVEELEKRIAEREAKIDELNHRFADPQTYRDPELAGRLQAELTLVRAELDEAMEAWSRQVT